MPVIAVARVALAVFYFVNAIDAVGYSTLFSCSSIPYNPITLLLMYVFLIFYCAEDLVIVTLTVAVKLLLLFSPLKSSYFTAYIILF